MTKENSSLKDRWDKRHSEASDSGEIADVLQENLHLLPKQGDALDLACGRGANALMLAGLGFNVTAWDLSPVAIDRLQQSAEEKQLTINAEVRDLLHAPFPGNAFDVILVSHFLERTLASSIVQALRHGGLLFYQTFTQTAVSDEGPSNPQFRLADNELIELFSALKVRVYREEHALGDTSKGWRDKALLIAQKV